MKSLIENFQIEKMLEKNNIFFVYLKLTNKTDLFKCSILYVKLRVVLWMVVDQI